MLDFDLCVMSAAEDAFFVALFLVAGIVLGLALSFLARRFDYLKRSITPTFFGASVGCLIPLVLGSLLAGAVIMPWDRYLGPEGCDYAFTPDGISLAFYWPLTPFATIAVLWWAAYRSSR